jgi:hypothetical protein
MCNLERLQIEKLRSTVEPTFDKMCSVEEIDANLGRAVSIGLKT